MRHYSPHQPTSTLDACRPHSPHVPVVIKPSPPYPTYRSPDRPTYFPHSKYEATSTEVFCPPLNILRANLQIGVALCRNRTKTHSVLEPPTETTSKDAQIVFFIARHALKRWKRKRQLSPQPPKSVFTGFEWQRPRWHNTARPIPRHACLARFAQAPEGLQEHILQFLRHTILLTLDKPREFKSPTARTSRSADCDLCQRSRRQFHARPESSGSDTKFRW